MADVQILEAYVTSVVPVNAGTTTFLTGDLLAGDGGGLWVKADADVAARSDCQWICMQSASAGGSTTHQMPVCKRAVIQDRDAPYTAGALIYMSATAGAFTETVPTVAIATVRRVVGKSITTSIAHLNMEVPHYYPSFSSGANAAHADMPFFIAPRPLRVLECRVSWDTAFGAAITLTIAKAASGTDITSGTNVLTGTFAAAGAGDTPNILGATTTAADARLATGNQLGVVFSATTTGIGVGGTAVLVDEQAI